MNGINKFCNRGNLVKADVCGVSVAGDRNALGPDSDDAKVSIEVCGDDVFEVWINTSKDYSIRIIADSKWMRDIGKAFIKAADVFGN